MGFYTVIHKFKIWFVSKPNLQPFFLSKKTSFEKILHLFTLLQAPTPKMQSIFLSSVGLINKLSLPLAFQKNADKKLVTNK
jgi:hypothetical protein